MQKIISGKDSHKQIQSILTELKTKKYLLVCDTSFQFLSIKDFFNEIKMPYVTFNDFTANPLYEDVCKGVELFNESCCDTIIAVGGGSTLDVAKCIKLFSNMDTSLNYLGQKPQANDVTLIALPTTAGTGSESTRFAVIYYNNEKQSITHQSIIPNYAILEYDLLKTLPLYQKKCTMLDALCQGIESYWSVNSNDESKEYAREAISLIMSNKNLYLENCDIGNEKVMLAANLAGRAINISQTTAAHAMSYKITSMYNLPHGHAVAICLPKVWEFMLNNIDKCSDSRGQTYVQQVFTELATILQSSNPQDAIKGFEELLIELNILPPTTINQADLDVLCNSVNVTRLINNPIALQKDDLYIIYNNIFNSNIH